MRRKLLPVCRIICSRLFPSAESRIRNRFLETLHGHQQRSYAGFPRQNQEASLDLLDDSRITSDLASFESLLRSCTRCKNLAHGQRVHHHIRDAGLQTNAFLCNLLIRMYSQCSALGSACSVFSQVLDRDTYTWNIMIGALLRHGESCNALLYYNRMLFEGYLPDHCTFSNALSACNREKNLALGKQIHSLAMARGLNSNPRVGTSLLEMYKKCGALGDVENMFCVLEDRDVFSWSVLISAYLQNGSTLKVLPFLQQMLQENVLPDNVIYVSTLASCDNERMLREGMRLHATIIGSKSELDHHLTSAVITMYGRCGSMLCAHSLFRELEDRDVIAWNSMIAFLVNQGCSDEAFQLYAEMLLEGVTPDEATFVSLLCACTCPIFLSKGIKLHDDIKYRGFESNIRVSTNLLNMYSRCGTLQQAWDVFNSMASRDVVSWNAMINACAKYQQGTEALKLFGNMQQNNVTPNKVTLLSVLQACTIDTKLVDGNQMHDIIVVNGFESDVVLATALITMYGKCGSLVDAWKLFSIIQERSIVSWNAMIAGYVQGGHVQHVIFLFQQMQLEGIMPNDITFVSLLTLHESGLGLNVGRRFHSCLRSFGLEHNVAVANALIPMYGKNGLVDDAMSIFRRLKRKNVVSWTAAMSVCLQINHFEECNSLFQEMQHEGIIPDKVSFVIMIDAVSYSESLIEGRLLHTCSAIQELDSNIDVANALVSMYGQLCSLEDVLSTFYALQSRNKQSFINILCACANIVALLDGIRAHTLMIADDILLDKLLGNNLINLYGKCGCVDDARWAFDRMDGRDTISWSNMINIYAQHGHGKEALSLFDKMQHEKIQPNEVTFLGVLSACNHTGLFVDGCCHFMSMTRDYGIAPSEDHYNCMVDLLSRSGRLEEAEDMILKIPSDRRGVAWMTLLGACVCRGDIERGERAAKCIFEVDPKNPVPYVILHNTLVSADGRRIGNACAFEEGQVVPCHSYGI